MIRKTLTTLLILVTITINAQASWWDKVTGTVDMIKSSAQNEVKIYPQIGHSSWTTAIAVSQDGSFIATGNADNNIMLWDAVTGRLLHTLSAHKSEVKSIAITPDGSKIVSCDEHTINVWDAQSALVVRSKISPSKYDTFHAIAISPDGRKFTDGFEVWDIDTGKHITTISASSNATAYAVVYSNDGKKIITGYYEAPITISDAESGIKLKTLVGHKQKVVSITISPDGRFLVSGDDNTVILWDAQSGAKLKTFNGRFNYLKSIAFSPDSSTIAIGSRDKTIQLWDVASASHIRTINTDKDGNYLAYLQGKKNIISADSSSNIVLWDSIKGVKVKKFLDSTNTAYHIDFSPDGHILVAGGRLWDLNTGKMNSVSFIWYSIYSPDGSTVVSSSGDKLKLLNATTGKEIHSFVGHTNDDSIMSSAISPNGRIIASGGYRKTIILWDAMSGKKLKTLKGHTDSVHEVVFSPDSKILASGSSDHTIILWDVISGGSIKNINTKSSVQGLAFSKDGRTIVYGGLTSNDVRVMDVKSGEVIKMMEHGSYIKDTALSPDGQTVASAGEDKKIKLWDVASGAEIKVIQTASAISHIRFSPSGKEIATGSGNGLSHIFSIASGKELVKFLSFENGEWITITPEGYYDASENGDKHLNVRTGSGLHDVYGIDQYRESFYRPDLVKLALSGGSLSDMRNIASVKPAPSVEIINTPETTIEGEAIITLKMKDMGGGIGDVRLYVNGSAVMLDNSRALKRVSDGTTRTYTLKLSNGKNSIRAIAFNADNSMQSTDALYMITSSFKMPSKPNLHAIIVGIQEFKNPKLNLQYPIADAKLFADTLKQSATGLFNHVEITQLTTREETTSENIKAELSKLKKLNPDDLFVFYVASHGTVDDGEYFLITSNVGITSTQHLKSDALPQNDLKELIANIPTTKKVIVLDTCNSGAMGDALQKVILTRGMSEDTAIKILSRAVGSTILSASTSTQEALEGYKGHGLFTYVLSEGIKGKADKGKTGFIKTTDLVDYVDTEVPELAEKVFKRAQYPTNTSNGQGFHIGKVMK